MRSTPLTSVPMLSAYRPLNSRGDAVELRSDSSAGTVMGVDEVGCAPRSAMMWLTAWVVTSAMGCTTAVSGGCARRMIGVSSKLISDRSPGTARLRERASSSVASVI